MRRGRRRATQQPAAARRRGGGRRVLKPLAQQAAARPAHAHLVLIDVFAARRCRARPTGAASSRGCARCWPRRCRTCPRRRASPRPRSGSWPPAACRPSSAACARARRAASSRPSDELAAWAATYLTATPLPLPKPGRPTPLIDGGPRSRGLPRNVQRLPRQFVVPHQRDRILRAVTALAAREGYADIGIPAIATEAQISIRTFYQHFSSKHEAFTAVYDLAFGKLFARTWAAASSQKSWSDAVREGVRAWVGYVAKEPDLARFGFSDMLTIGREAVEKVDNAYYAFGDLFGRGRPGDGRGLRVGVLRDRRRDRGAGGVLGRRRACRRCRNNLHRT